MGWCGVLTCLLATLVSASLQYEMLGNGTVKYRVFMEQRLSMMFPFDSGQAFCKQHGGKLPEPKNRQAMIDIATFVPTASIGVALGMTDRAVDGTWVWDSDGSPVTWFNWATHRGEPSGTTLENCVISYSKLDLLNENILVSGWADYFCDFIGLDPYIVCQYGDYDAVTTTTTTTTTATTPTTPTTTTTAKPTPKPIDGGWDAWPEWSDCSVTCGKGQKTRTRTCTSPPPQHGGKGCEGVSQQHEECHTGECPSGCAGSEFGCCPDDFTSATGLNHAGCGAVIPKQVSKVNVTKSLKCLDMTDEEKQLLMKIKKPAKYDECCSKQRFKCQAKDAIAKPFVFYYRDVICYIEKFRHKYCVCGRCVEVKAGCWTVGMCTPQYKDTSVKATCFYADNCGITPPPKPVEIEVDLQLVTKCSCKT